MTVQISRGFRDISLAFKRHPITNDVTVLKNEDAIKKSVVNLVQTRLDERFFNDLLGTSIYNTLFSMHFSFNSILPNIFLASSAFLSLHSLVSIYLCAF